MFRLFLFIFLCIFFSFNVKADIFVYKVSNKATIKSDSVKVKQNVINESRLEALISVLKKITSRKDYKKIEEIFNTNSAYLYEKKFLILKEEATRNEYSGIFVFNFDRDKILQTLEEAKITYILNDLGKEVVVPIYLDHSQDSKSREWNNVWEDSEYSSFLSTPVLYNTGSEKIDSNTVNHLRNLYNAYSVYQVTLIKKGSTFNLEVFNLLNQNKTVVENLTNSLQAQEEAMAIIEQSRKEEFLDIYSTTQGDTIFKVDISNYNNWIGIESVLLNDDSIRLAQVTEIDENNLSIRIKYLGTIKSLAESLNKFCLVLDIYEFTISKNTDCV